MSAFTLATAQYDIGFFPHWDDFAAKLERWVASAVQQDAKLLVFPEYGSMELASLFGQAVYSDLQQQLQAMQTLLPKWRDLHQALARRNDVLILASSFPTELQAGHVVNRATLFGPEGILGHQDKLIMTRFENEQWGIRAGERIGVIDTELGRIGILICYDSEFPMIARQQITAGAELLLVPSCTDTQAGFHGCVSVARRGRWKTSVMWSSRLPPALRPGPKRLISIRAAPACIRRWIMVFRITASWSKARMMRRTGCLRPSTCVSLLGYAQRVRCSTTETGQSSWR